MRCIEIRKADCLSISSPLINRNMRCIEIPTITTKLGHMIRLIETWDVLKLQGKGNEWSEAGKINRNMRCIEINQWYAYGEVCCRINRNMRCIEIAVNGIQTKLQNGINRNMRCIEMFEIVKKLIHDPEINRNMRCIEIYL